MPAENILITCAKDAWYKKGNVDVAGPSASGSKLFKGANWVAKVTRGTNDYAHCSHLIYLYDQHMNPYVARWLEDNSRAFDDAYALTEMIQWVWRSRVRKGQWDCKQHTSQAKDAVVDGEVAGSLTAVGACVVLRRIVSIVT